MKWALSACLLAGAVLLVWFGSGWPELVSAAERISGQSIVIALLALTANALAASFRFKLIASDVGYPISMPSAMAAVGFGSLGGAVFFQIAGQLIARGAVMAQSGVEFSPVVVMTIYERVVAAAVSVLLAIVGAILLFGHLAFDLHGGGTDLVKIVVGLTAAIAAAAALGYGRVALPVVAPLINRQSCLLLLRSLALSLLVQAPMMAAYVAIAHVLAPDVSLLQLSATFSIVMLAASIPVSFAGWGIRELSAIAALGVIGVDTATAFVIAAVIGAGSMLVMAAMAAASLPFRPRQTAPALSSPPIEYERALAWVLPLITATAVLFQIYVPVGSGLLNVNLADPVAILGGSLFVLQAARSGQAPKWRFEWLNIAILAATLVLSMALLIGAARIGWTQWAVVNRFLGWFVLLGFGATGAMLIAREGESALIVLLRTFAAAACAVSACEIILLTFRSGQADLWNATGFALNHNFFALQLLMAVAAATAAWRKSTTRSVLLAVLITGVVCAGSRSGWIALGLVLAGGLYLRSLRLREIATIGLAVTAMVTVAVFSHDIFSQLASQYFPQSGMQSQAIPIPQVIPTGANTAERLLSLTTGWKMFLDYPLFGAGLGAFRSLGLTHDSGLPMLIHNSALWLMAEAGLVGLLAFAVPSITIMISEIRRPTHDTASVFIVLAMLALTVMSGPADMIYQRTFWMLMGAALASRVWNGTSAASGYASATR